MSALDRLIDAADALVGLDFRQLDAEGTAVELADTRVAQPLLYLVDWAWGTFLLESGVGPVAVAGHSLGELAALAIAGVYSAEAGLALVCERSRLMAQAAAASPGTMAAVLGMRSEDVASAISDIASVWLANDNSPGQVVISGRKDGVETAADALREAGARRVAPLDVSGGFHSPLMSEAATRFSEILVDAEFHDAAIPVVQNVRPTPATDADEIKLALAEQIDTPVRWTETMQALAAYSPVTLVEAGPGSVLTGLARRVNGIEAVDIESTGVKRLLEEVLV
jgi:[acyl-carrier-protein] S-malonyltransferase